MLGWLASFLRMLAGGARTYDTMKDINVDSPGKAADALNKAANAADKLTQKQK